MYKNRAIANKEMMFVGLLIGSTGFFKYEIKLEYLQPIITQYFIDNKSELWLLFLIAHSKR